MATKAKEWDAEVAPWTDPDVGSFDITCVIGTVEYSRNGHGKPAHVAAFELIAAHDAPGQYSFPMPYGGTCRVTVEHEIGPVEGES